MIMKRLTTLLAALAASQLGAPLRAQVPFQTFESQNHGAGEEFAATVSCLGDTDGDGKPDFLCSSPRWSAQASGTFRGRVRAISGASGNERFAVAGGYINDGSTSWTNQADFLAWDEQGAVGVGDVNGDGVGDLLLGAHAEDSSGNNNSGGAWVYSGASGALLYSFLGAAGGDYLGYACGAVGDLDGDGAADLLIGSHAANPSGQTDAGAVYVRSGATGSLLYRVDGDSAGDNFGVSMAGIGDVNFDGHADFVVGAHLDEAGSAFDTGSARVVSGLDGSLLVEVHGLAANDHLGRRVANAGDVDGDGFDDFLAWAPGAEQVHLYSVFGALLHVFSSPAPGIDFGTAIAGVGDVNGDGRADIAVGAPGHDAGGGADQGAVFLYSAANGYALFQTLLGEAPGDRFGDSIDGLGAGVELAGDWNGDGLDDLIVAAPHAFANRGRAYVMPGTCLPPATYCTAGANSVGANGAHLTAGGSLSFAANDFTLTVSGLPASQPGLFYYGEAAIDFPFGNGRRCVGGTSFRFQPQYSNASGLVTRAFDWNAPPQPSGQVTAMDTWYLQFWYRDPQHFQMGAPASFNLSDALVLTICP